MILMMTYLTGWWSVEIKLRSSVKVIGHPTMFLSTKRWASLQSNDKTSIHLTFTMHYPEYKYGVLFVVTVFH